MLRHNRVSVFSLTFVAALASASALFAAPKAIRVAIFSDAGVTKADVKQIERCLPESQGFVVKRITAEEIRDSALKDFEVLIHPGGSASKQGETLGEKGRDAVKKFVDGGGGFIGICAGAYLASAQYKWSLGVLDARVIDGAHWARGEGEVKLHLTSAGQEALQSEKQSCSIHFENGPLLGPGKKKEIEDYEPLATFETEMRKNDAPPGIMKDTTAIARGKFGKGRVVCFSPHPEKTPGREMFLQQAARWSAGLAPLVGQDVILHGRFGGPGKLADYILTDAGQVYLYRPNANAMNYGTQITVRGKLQQYTPPEKKSPGTDEPTRARAPEHYFIDSPKVVLESER